MLRFSRLMKGRALAVSFARFARFAKVEEEDIVSMLLLMAQLGVDVSIEE